MLFLAVGGDILNKKARMTKAPVYYVLAQAKFNPIAAMGDKYVNDIQDRLRQAGYTLFEQQNIAQIQLGNPEVCPISQVSQWLVSKENMTSGFILTASSLMYHTTHYETSEEFIPEFLRGLQIVHDVVSLDHISRLGLRYLDAVVPSSHETVRQYLVNGLHGVDFKAEQEYTLTESVFKTNSGPLLSNGKLVARVLQLASSLLVYPADLLPQKLVPMKRFEFKEPCAHAVIDTDHFVEGHMPVDFDKIKAQLVSLHAINKEAFESAVSAHAKKIWA